MDSTFKNDMSKSICSSQSSDSNMTSNLSFEQQLEEKKEEVEKLNGDAKDTLLE